VGDLRNPSVFSPAGKGSSSVLLCTNSVSACESIGECCATHQFSLQLGRDLAGSGYSPIVFPAGKGLSRSALPTSSLSGREDIFACLAKPKFMFPPGNLLWSVALPTSSLSSRAGILQVLATHQLYFWLEKDFGGLRYPAVVSPAGKRSSSVLLSTNSVAACKGIG